MNRTAIYSVLEQIYTLHHDQNLVFVIKNGEYGGS
jgi:hypothetical protein